MSLRIDNQIYW